MTTLNLYAATVILARGDAFKALSFTCRAKDENSAVEQSRRDAVSRFPGLDVVLAIALPVPEAMILEAADDIRARRTPCSFRSSS